MVFGKSNKLIDTKNSNNTNPKSIFSISDVNKLYRREEGYKKKLKVLIQTNTLLESRIRVYEQSIRDEREGILFQLNELSKTMNNKISSYLQQKLDRQHFKDNITAKQTIKKMIEKFQDVQKETKITRKVHQNLSSIYQRYVNYSEQIDKLVKLTQKSNKQYEDSMKNMLYEKQSQIFRKRAHNDQLFEDTQTATNKIDQFQKGKLQLIQQETQLEKQIQELQQTEKYITQQVKKFQKWAEVVIDKNHRKVYNKQSKSRESELQKIQQTNEGLQIYLKQLGNEQLMLQKMLKQQKQNAMLIQNAKAKEKVKKNKTKYDIKIKV